MSLIRYNGIQLNVVKVISKEAKLIMTDDGADALYVHHTLHVSFVYNFAATGPGGPGNSIPIVEAALMTPRKPLVFAIGGATVLESPVNIAGVQAGVDAYLGPRPLFAKLTEVHGTSTAIGEFAIETWLIPGTASASALIANRWEETHDIDEVFLTTRTVTGTCWVRSDVASVNKVTPDSFRQDVNHSIPDGYQRHNVNVIAGSDGTMLDYSFDDVQQPMNYGRDNMIIKIDGKLGSGIDWASSTMPVSWRALSVQVWGRPECQRNQLAGAINTIAAGYRFVVDFSALKNTTRGYFSNAQVWVSLRDRYAEGQFKYVLGGYQGQAQAFVTFNDSDPVDPSYMSNDIVDVNGFLMGTNAPRPNPRPLAAAGTRSTAIQALAQALQTPFSAPPTSPQ